MGPLATVVHALADVVRRDRPWMGWNLVLAMVPAVLAVAVCRHRGRRGPGWWLGAGLLVLFLPNAPYVLTDLVHLRGDVVAAGGDLAVVGAVLPVYAGFIAAGFVAYAVAVGEVGRWLDREGLGRWRPAAEGGLHLVCAAGILLGRVARVNSWEPVTRPHSTAERAVLTITWRWAPVAVAVTFVATWVGHELTRGVGRSLARRAGALVAPWAGAGPETRSS
jgi:uncharacterized membrane protein